jgi:predicted nucleotidyltransferase
VSEKGYLAQLVRRLEQALGDELVAVYLTGSGALGDWVPGRSDIDVMVICDVPLTIQAKHAVVAPLLHRALPCPGRVLELVVYSRARASAPQRRAEFEINLNTGATLVDHVSFDPPDEPWHWFVIDLAIARDAGRPLIGPPPQEVIGAPARADLIAALRKSLHWHQACDGASADAVLNACRAWRYAVEGVWSSKRDAGAWALGLGAEGDLLGKALAMRRGFPGQLDPAAVNRFVNEIAARIP